MEQPARYPVYVRQDDLCLRELPTLESLAYFERFDIEEEPIFAWDSAGNRHQLIWNEEQRRPGLQLIEHCDLAGFRRAVDTYTARVQSMSPQKLARQGYARPDDLSRLLSSLGAPRCSP